MALKFESDKSEFNLKSGNKSGLPFKEMGSTVAKHLSLSRHTHGPGGEIIKKGGLGTSTSLGGYDSKTKEEIKADEQTKKILAKTDKDIASTKTAAETKSYKDRVANVREREISLKEKIHADKTSTKKTGPSIEQQLADKKLKDLKKKKLRLGEKGYAKGWSDKKLARKEKRLTRKVKKAKKMTDPLERQEKAMRSAKAQDIFKALSMGGSKWAGSRTAAQDALRAQHQQGLVDKDVDTIKSSGEKELPPGDTFVHDYTTGKHYSGSKPEDLGLGFKEKGKVDYGTWSDEDLEKRRTDPTYRPS